MRICLVSHGFPPLERTGVENYTAGLAKSLAAAGHRVEVFTPRRQGSLPDYSLRREEREGFAVTWVTVNRQPENPREHLEVPGVAKAFGAFLDRERPQVVHFQHVVKLGLGIIEEARERGLPTFYTAHDYYAICHRYTLLRPDLEHCEARGDAAACSRCDLALGHLNDVPGLGDYQMGVLPGQITPAHEERLAGILAGTPGSLHEEAFSVAQERRTELDELRAKAFQGIDRVVAPTAFLGNELVRGGLARERIEVLPYGIENADLVTLPRPSFSAEKPPRLGFFGGLAKHKGVHDLVEGYRLSGIDAPLSIWGYSTDRIYVDDLRAKALAAGAQWRGSYERADLPGLFSEVDVVVVPSIWVENFPLVIREAFSAGRPVIAPRFGALPESVRDGIDGLLFEPRDPQDLARLLRRLVDEPDLAPQLAAGIEPVKGMEEQARELVERYQTLLDARTTTEVPADLPTSLQAFHARHAELVDKPTRELFHSALSGLANLRTDLEPEIGAFSFEEVLTQALEDGSHAQTWIRDAHGEIDWLRSSIEQTGEQKDELLGMLDQLERVILENQRGDEARTTEMEQAVDYLREKERALQSLEGELSKATEFIRTKEGELEEAQERMRRLEEHVAEKDQHIAQVEGHLGEKEQHIAQVKGHVAEKDQHIAQVEGYLEEKDQHIARVEGHLEEKARSLQSIEGELREAAEYIEGKEGAVENLESTLSEAAAHILRIEAELSEAAERVDQTTGDVTRLDAELEAARAELAHLTDYASEKESSLEQVEDRLDEAGQYIRTKEGLLERTEEELARSADYAREKESSLDEALEVSEERREDIQVGAQVGLSAIQAQHRILSRFLAPILTSLHEASGAEGELELPAPEAPFGELLESMRMVLRGMDGLGEELAWRRETMEAMDGEIGHLRHTASEHATLKEEAQEVARLVQRFLPGFLRSRSPGGRLVDEWIRREGL